jgi:hypothetical protein
MLGQTTLGGQVRDLRTVWRHIHKRYPTRDVTVAVGGSGIEPLAADASFSYPRRVDRPVECQPEGALLAMLLALYEDEIDSVVCRHGLVSYRSVLDSPFVQVPHACIVPGAIAAGDLPTIVEALHAQDFAADSAIDGRGRLVPNR